MQVLAHIPANFVVLCASVHDRLGPCCVGLHGVLYEQDASTGLS